MTLTHPPASADLPELPAGYRLRQGLVSRDGSVLLTVLQRTYQELYPEQANFDHLCATVEQYFSSDTPLWWVEFATGQAATVQPPGAQSVGFGFAALHSVAPPPDPVVDPVAGLWLGSVMDQGTGDRHAYIFLLYVCPTHRRLGIGSALLKHAEAWARARGDRQIGLQVFQDNQPALHLYEKQGYTTQSLWLVKPLR